VNAVRIAPADHVDGDVTVPGDKSISHRALIVGALARGRSYAGNVSHAADVQSTVACLRACGVWIRDFTDGRIAVEGSGPGESLQTPAGPLDCGNSGTTMRLLSGAIAGHDCEAVLDGDASLRRRPMARVADPLEAMGAAVQTAPQGTAPLAVRGRRELRAIHWETGVASAQVKSAILLAALSADGPTTVVEPRPTRDHTERLLRHCGVSVQADDTGGVTLTPGAVAPFGVRVPGDISSAAFFLALAAPRPGWRIRCPGVGLNPGRTGIIDALRAMGADITVEVDDGGDDSEPSGAVEVRGRPLHGATISGELTVRSIDELPVIAVLATQAEGVTHIRDAAELRAKESDRIAATADGLRAFGATCDVTDDGLVITGAVQLKAAHVDSHGDHRLAMAWGIAGMLCEGTSGTSVIEGAEAAAVSYPRFFDELMRVIGA
jgi:3-phosphoshikimate 1-carboxyvinyltransferase